MVELRGADIQARLKDIQRRLHKGGVPQGAPEEGKGLEDV